MKAGLTALLLASAVLGSAFPSFAQPPRQDAIWARSTAGAPITLDGNLNEPAWALAEQKTIQWAVDSGIPGSGWKRESSSDPTDPTFATLKFLVVGNQLYLGAVVNDQSIGGSQEFNVFDGFLMMIKNHANNTHPAAPIEYLYSWWYFCDPMATAPGKMPGFVSGTDAAYRYGNIPCEAHLARDPADVANWDAVTVVNGTTNSDAAADVGYTVEMRFNLQPIGYHVDAPGGDVVEWNISIYDCDFNWPSGPNTTKNRTWWQSPWGNDPVYNEVRIFARPDVTINSGPVPAIAPEMIVPSAGALAAPVVDGLLNDNIWSFAPQFDIRYGDDALRNTYPGMGPWRAGQFQPPINGNVASIVDPGDATVKYIFKGNFLYLGFDVRDKLVSFDATNFDLWDGFLVSINDRAELTLDNNTVGRRLTWQVNSDGTALPQDYLVTLINDLGGAQLACALKPGSTVNNPADVDQGYTAELAIDLTKIGYPAGLGDHLLFWGVDLLDGDIRSLAADTYGTRTWWQREYEGRCCPIWAYMDPTAIVGVGDPDNGAPGFALLGSYPNPFRTNTVIRYQVAEPSDAMLEIFDMQGRLVASRALGRQEPGIQQASWDGVGSTGLYVVRLRMLDPESGTIRATLSGKLLYVK